MGEGKYWGCNVGCLVGSRVGVFVGWRVMTAASTEEASTVAFKLIATDAKNEGAVKSATMPAAKSSGEE